MNPLEQSVLDYLVAENGQVWDSIDIKVIEEKLSLSLRLYSAATNGFRTNPSAHNYNILLTSMLTLQYWQGKQVKSFTLEAEF